MIIMSVYSDFFDDCGNFIHEWYDPYRVSDKFVEFHQSLFDEDGYVHFELVDLLRVWIHDHKVDAFSDLVKLYHAEMFARNTKGNYPTVYMWR